MPLISTFMPTFVAQANSCPYILIYSILMKFLPQTIEEVHNTLTHLIGALAAASMLWLLVALAIPQGWQWMMGVLFLGIGTILMYAFSTTYHWMHTGRAKQVLRIFDHIGIYIMIASSYTPICIAVIGGWLGWTVFAVLWAVVIAGAFYKVAAIGRYPRLSLFLYLVMGWSGVFIAKPVYDAMPASALQSILAEGLFYTGGTWFYAHDERPFYHAIWHLFVLAGTISHWIAIILLLT